MSLEEPASDYLTEYRFIKVPSGNEGTVSNSVEGVMDSMSTDGNIGGHMNGKDTVMHAGLEGMDSSDSHQWKEEGVMKKEMLEFKFSDTLKSDDQCQADFPIKPEISTTGTLMLYFLMFATKYIPPYLSMSHISISIMCLVKWCRCPCFSTLLVFLINSIDDITL